MFRIIVLLTVAALIYSIIGLVAAVGGLALMLAMAAVVLKKTGRRAQDLELARINIKAMAYNASMKRMRGEPMARMEELVLGWARPTVPSWEPSRHAVEQFMRSCPGWRDVRIVG